MARKTTAHQSHLPLDPGGSEDSLQKPTAWAQKDKARRTQQLHAEALQTIMAEIDKAPSRFKGKGAQRKQAIEQCIASNDLKTIKGMNIVSQFKYHEVPLTMKECHPALRKILSFVTGGEQTTTDQLFVKGSKALTKRALQKLRELTERGPERAVASSKAPTGATYVPDSDSDSSATEEDGVGEELATARTKIAPGDLTASNGLEQDKIAPDVRANNPHKRRRDELEEDREGPEQSVAQGDVPTHKKQKSCQPSKSSAKPNRGRDQLDEASSGPEKMVARQDTSPGKTQRIGQPSLSSRSHKRGRDQRDERTSEPEELTAEDETPPQKKRRSHHHAESLETHEKGSDQLGEDTRGPEKMATQEKTARQEEQEPRQLTATERWEEAGRVAEARWAAIAAFSLPRVSLTDIGRELDGLRFSCESFAVGIIQAAGLENLRLTRIDDQADGDLKRFYQTLLGQDWKTAISKMPQRVKAAPVLVLSALAAAAMNEYVFQKDLPWKSPTQIMDDLGPVSLFADRTLRTDHSQHFNIESLVHKGFLNMIQDKTFRDETMQPVAEKLASAFLVAMHPQLFLIEGHKIVKGDPKVQLQGQRDSLEWAFMHALTAKSLIAAAPQTFRLEWIDHGRAMDNSLMEDTRRNKDQESVVWCTNPAVMCRGNATDPWECPRKARVVARKEDEF